jgi:hypothetical protein
MEGAPVDTAFQHDPAVAQGTIKDLLISIERPYQAVEKGRPTFFQLATSRRMSATRCADQSLSVIDRRASHPG